MYIGRELFSERLALDIKSDDIIFRARGWSAPAGTRAPTARALHSFRDTQRHLAARLARDEGESNVHTHFFFQKKAAGVGE
jgi:hypothetical protein